MPSQTPSPSPKTQEQINNEYRNKFEQNIMFLLVIKMS